MLIVVEFIHIHIIRTSLKLKDDPWPSSPSTTFLSPFLIRSTSNTVTLSTMPPKKKAAAKKVKATTPASSDETTNKENTKKKQKLNDEPLILTDDEKRVVIIQYEKENDTDNVDSLITEYLKFMQIKIAEKDTDGKKAAPSNAIDDVWHAHILSTKEYFAFCARYNDGEYLHHDPSLTDVPARYLLTMQRYRELFGMDPTDKSIWPTLSVSRVSVDSMGNVIGPDRPLPPGHPSLMYGSEDEYELEDGDPGCG